MANLSGANAMPLTHQISKHNGPSYSYCSPSRACCPYHRWVDVKNRSWVLRVSAIGAAAGDFWYHVLIIRICLWFCNVQQETRYYIAQAVSGYWYSNILLYIYYLPQVRDVILKYRWKSFIFFLSTLSFFRFPIGLKLESLLRFPPSWGTEGRAFRIHKRPCSMKY
jgi:hypothetical protein